MFRVLLVDDHKVFLESIKDMLQGVKNVNVDSVDNVVLAKKMLASCPYDLIISDIQFPDKEGGEELVSHVKLNFPQIKVLVLTSSSSSLLFAKLKRIGVEGFLGKTVSRVEFLSAFDKVIKGEVYYQSFFRDYLLNSSECASFTPRELEVLKLIFKEYTTSEISQFLGISYHTADGYRKQLMLKTGATNVVGLVKYVYTYNIF